jgi:redox-sensitive bicupin YhaK (pirin superfamily)
MARLVADPARTLRVCLRLRGQGTFGADDRRVITAPCLVVWDDGDSVDVRAGQSAVRFLLVSGKPLNEPIARYGPFVMNTKEEIEQTLRELRDGTFIR